MKWKEEQTKKVDSIQKDRIDVLKKGGVKNVQYFKGLFSSTKIEGLSCYQHRRSIHEECMW